MAKTVTEGRRPDATAGADAIYRNLFGSFSPDKNGRISPLEVLSRLERCGLRADDPRIAEALAGLADADGSRQLSFRLVLGWPAGLWHRRGPRRARLPLRRGRRRPPV
jgi:hypothetical protein